MSDFRLYPVPQGKLGCLEKLLETARKEMKVEKRSDVSYILARVEDGYSSRSMAAYVDSLESPSHCLILATWPGIITKGVIATVVLIYSLPEVRGNKEVLKTLMSTIENYARLSGADTILGSAWKYGCESPIDSLWKKYKYVEQETTYVKLL
jgi:hypothetical protein